MSTHNIGFYEDLTKIIFELSSNMHLSNHPKSPVETEVPPKDAEMMAYSADPDQTAPRGAV